jgi:hypothetical protein
LFHLIHVLVLLILLSSSSAMVTWNQTKHSPYWLELSHAKYFPLHLSEPISRRIGWIQFPMFCFPAVLVGTNFPPSAVLCGTFLCKIFPALLVGTNYPPYWLEPIPCCSAFPAVLVGTNFPPY